MTGTEKPRHAKVALWTALHAFQSEATGLQKDKINPAFRSKYLSLDALHEQVMPLLNKHGLVWTTAPNFQAHGGTIEPNLSYRLIHAASGEETSGTLPLILGKRDMQGLGSAVTYARRYALMSVLGLVADEDDDGNAASRPAKKKAASNGNGVHKLTAAQIEKVRGAIVDAGEDFTATLAAVGVKAPDSLTTTHAREIRELLDAAVAA